MGTGNDTFVRLATPTARAVHWVRQTVRELGPILVSMVGRLYHKAHGTHFTHDFPQGVTKFLSQHLQDELDFEEQKGQEQLVELKAAHAVRFFVPEKKRGGPASAPAREDLVKGRLAVPGVPYRTGDKILVVGDADFSWSAALSKLWGRGGAEGLVASSYEAKQKITNKYPKTRAHLDELNRAGATVQHSVDAMTLGQEGNTKCGKNFDTIVFNFPHTGTDSGLEASIEANQALLRGFLTTAPGLLAQKAKGGQTPGEIHVTLVNRYPYTAWKSEWIGESASLEEVGLEYLGHRDFEAGDYPGYEHQAYSSIK